jgi:hypothetical protein
MRSARVEVRKREVGVRVYGIIVFYLEYPGPPNLCFLLFPLETLQQTPEKDQRESLLCFMVWLLSHGIAFFLPPCCCV